MIENRIEDEELVPESADPADTGSVRSRGAGTPEAGEAPAPPPDDDEPEEEKEEALLSLEGTELQRAIEAVLFVQPEPISVRALSDLVGASLHDVRAAIEELRLEYVDTGRAFRLEDIAGGVQILTLKAYDPWIRKLRKKQRESRLSPAALEALAVIAYKQPIGKADLDAIRGVNCAPTLKTLLERGLVQVVGRAEGLGRPLLYGTTKRFLESFGISSVRELPQPDSESQTSPRSGNEKEESPPEPGEGRLYPEPEEDAAGLDEDADEGAEDDSESGEERES